MACSSDDDAADPTAAPTTVAPSEAPTTPAATEPAPEEIVPETEPAGGSGSTEPEATEVDREPVETEPADTEPPDTEPADTEPADTEPPDTEPADTEPVDTEPAVALVTPEGDEFFVAPDPLPSDAPGDLIWARDLPNTPAGSVGWQVLYVSEDLSGNAIPVSGVVIAPEAAATDAVVLTWAHGTTGLGDSCAPSKAWVDGGGYDAILAGAAVEKGWTFVATDYEGLGTEGVHPYLVGQSEGRGVLDIVRAARQIDDSGATDASQVIIFGHSQGGHAALMAGEIAAAYAPDVDVVGTVGGAPPGELGLIESATSGGGGGGLGGFGLMMIAGFIDAYPELPIDAVANAEWLPLLTEVGDTCLGEAFGLAGTATGPRPNGTQNPEWAAAFDANSPGNVAPEAPVLMIHGDADEVVPTALSEIIHGKYCELGIASQRTIYPGADHVSVLFDAFGDIEQWMDDRVAGAPAPSNC